MVFVTFTVRLTVVLRLLPCSCCSCCGARRWQNKVSATEYKVKWAGLSSAHSKYMTEEACKETFGEATFGELLDDWNKWAHVEEEWVCRGTWARVTTARLLNC